MISGIERNGVSVIIPKYGFEGFIEYSEEEEASNKKLINEAGKKVVTECLLSGKKYKIFDRVDILLSMEMKHFRKQIKIRTVE